VNREVYEELDSKRTKFMEETDQELSQLKEQVKSLLESRQKDLSFEVNAF